MVAVSSSQADRFIDQASSSIDVFLLHGPDSGLIAERTIKIIQLLGKSKDTQIDTLSIGGEEISAFPGRLVDEANSKCLFFETRALVVDLAGKDISSEVEVILQSATVENRVIIKAGVLRSDSPLKKLCERNKKAAALACEPDTQDEIKRLVREELSLAGISADPNTQDLLASLLGADRGSTRLEISKLLLYSAGKSTVTEEDVRAVVADAQQNLTETAVFSAFLGDISKLEEQLDVVAVAGVSPETILRQALNLGLQIHGKYRPKDIQDGANSRIISSWTSERARSAILILSEAIQKTRRQPALAQQLTIRALWSVCRLAPR